MLCFANSYTSMKEKAKLLEVVWTMVSLVSLTDMKTASTGLINIAAQHYQFSYCSLLFVVKCMCVS